jgi:choline-sulfatase
LRGGTPHTAIPGRRKPSRSFPILLLLLLLFLLLLAACKPHEQAPQHPNVILITLDTFRADHIGPATPHLQQLATRGVVFEDAQSAVPLTLPAHATILSGVLPLHHGLRNNGAGVFPAERNTLATTLSRAGYRTAAFVGAFVLDHRFGLGRGFDLYDDAITRDPNDDASSIEAERRGSEVIDRALAWLKHGDRRPYFLWVHLYDAHAPYAPPAPYPQTYDGEIAYLDAQVGRLLAAVDGRSTMIAVVGDHGEALGEHGELTHGLLLYQATLQVPLMIAGPALPARHVKTPVGTVDLPSTLAALAGTELHGQDGRDLSADLRAGRDPQPAELYAETQYPLSFGWSELSSLRRRALKVIAAPAPEVYDLSRDPKENVNVLDDERRAYSDLSKLLLALRATAVTTSASTVDAETRAKLASLGYVAPTGNNAGSSQRDPKMMAPLFRRFEETMWALNRGKPGEAIEPLRTLVAEDPGNRIFRSSLARAYRQQGDLRSALVLYRDAVALAPGDSESWYNLAVALQEAGNDAEARAAIDEVIRRDPRRPEAHNALGVSFANAGSAEKAADEFRRTVELDPRNARAFNNLGNALRAMGRADDAAEAYRQSLQLAPDYPDAMNGLGVLYVQGNRPREAIPLFERAIQLAPDFYEARLNRGIALQLAGDRPAAAAAFHDLLGRLPAGPRYEAQRKAAQALLAQR